MASTVDILGALLEELRAVEPASSALTVRDAACDAVAALLGLRDVGAARDAGDLLVSVRRACHAAAQARDAAILARRPADAALLDAVVRVASAAESLTGGDEAEARAFAGAALAPLSERLVLTGAATDDDSAVAAVKAALRERLRR